MNWDLQKDIVERCYHKQISLPMSFTKHSCFNKESKFSSTLRAAVLVRTLDVRVNGKPANAETGPMNSNDRFA